MATSDTDEDGSPQIREPHGVADDSTNLRLRSATLEAFADLGAHAPPRTEAFAREPDLTRTIQSEIIPRLLMAYRRSEARQSSVAVEESASQTNVERLVTLAMADTFPNTISFVETLRAVGATAETIIADLLPAAARHVGWMWETDACTFLDVTFTLTRLQQILRHYAPSLEMVAHPDGESRRILLTAMPGEQHTFGLSVVGEFFRRASWDVSPLTPVATTELLSCVGGEWFDVIGLSAASDGAFCALPSLIQKIRMVSVNRSIRVLVGGPAILRRSDEAGTVGADAVARDPNDGIDKAEWIMRSLMQPC